MNPVYKFLPENSKFIIQDTKPATTYFHCTVLCVIEYCNALHYEDGMCSFGILDKWSNIEINSEESQYTREEDPLFLAIGGDTNVVDVIDLFSDTTPKLVDTCNVPDLPVQVWDIGTFFLEDKFLTQCNDGCRTLEDGSWSDPWTLSSERVRNFGAVNIPGIGIWVIGGVTVSDTNTLRDQTYIINPHERMESTPGPTLPEPMKWSGSTYINETSIFISIGSSHYSFDWNADEWTNLTTIGFDVYTLRLACSVYQYRYLITTGGHNQYDNQYLYDTRYLDLNNPSQWHDGVDITEHLTNTMIDYNGRVFAFPNNKVWEFTFDKWIESDVERSESSYRYQTVIPALKIFLILKLYQNDMHPNYII